MKKPITNTPINCTSPFIILLSAVFALLFLSSCATLKKDDCVEGNWSGIGFNDAAAGLKSGSQFGAHTKACSKYKITPNTAQYNSGYKKGLLQFCTASKGYKHGVEKEEYYAVCPQGLQRNFLKGYLAGLDTATAEITEDIADLRHDRRRAISKYRGIKSNKKPNGKKIKKWADRIDDLESSIDSRRSDRKKLRRWHNYWATKL